MTTVGSTEANLNSITKMPLTPEAFTQAPQEYHSHITVVPSRPLPASNPPPCARCCLRLQVAAAGWAWSGQSAPSVGQAWRGWTVMRCWTGCRAAVRRLSAGGPRACGCKQEALMRPQQSRNHEAAATEYRSAGSMYTSGARFASGVFPAFFHQ